MKQRLNGFTLIELLVVVTIIVTVMGMTMSAILPTLSSGGLETAARKLQAALKKAQRLAFESGKVHSVVFNMTTTGEDGRAVYFSRSSADNWYAIVEIPYYCFDDTDPDNFWPSFKRDDIEKDDDPAAGPYHTVFVTGLAGSDPRLGGWAPGVSAKDVTGSSYEHSPIAVLNTDFNYNQVGKRVYLEDGVSFLSLCYSVAFPGDTEMTPWFETNKPGDARYSSHGVGTFCFDAWVASPGSVTSTGLLDNDGELPYVPHAAFGNFRVDFIPDTLSPSSVAAVAGETDILQQLRTHPFWDTGAENGKVLTDLPLILPVTPHALVNLSGRETGTAITDGSLSYRFGLGNWTPQAGADPIGVHQIVLTASNATIAYDPNEYSGTMVVSCMINARPFLKTAKSIDVWSRGRVVRMIDDLYKKDVNGDGDVLDEELGEHAARGYGAMNGTGNYFLYDPVSNGSLSEENMQNMRSEWYRFIPPEGQDPNK